MWTIRDSKYIGDLAYFDCKKNIYFSSSEIRV